MAQQSGSGSLGLPRDAKLITAILKEMNITDYEPRVINQLLEFVYKYVADVLDDARVYSDFASKRAIDAEDVRLAIQMKVERSFSRLPPRELLLEIARERNSVPLTSLKPGMGLKLPPDRYCLLQPNFRLKTSKQVVVATPRFVPGGPPAPRFGPPRPNAPSPMVYVQKQGAQSAMHPPPVPPSYPPISSRGPTDFSSIATSQSFYTNPSSAGSTPNLNSGANFANPQASASAAPPGPRSSIFRVVSSDSLPPQERGDTRKRKYDDLDEDYDEI